MFIDNVMNQSKVVNYLTEFLNSLDLTGIQIGVFVLMGVSSVKYQSTMSLQRYNHFCEKYYEKCHLNYNFESKIQGGSVSTVAMYSNDHNRYTV